MLNVSFRSGHLFRATGCAPDWLPAELVAHHAPAIGQQLGISVSEARVHRLGQSAKMFVEPIHATTFRGVMTDQYR